MAAERVSAEEHDVRCEKDRADADAELGRSRRRIREPHRLPRIVREEHDKDQREVQEVAVDVLDDERKRALSAISFSRLADSAARRIGPERLVVCAAIVVAGESESCRERQDDQCGRER